MTGGFVSPIEAKRLTHLVLGLCGLTVLVVVSRIPLIFQGHGTDPDAWRVVLAARHLLDTGTYQASRYPGNPVHEIGTALVLPGGTPLVNGLSALFCALGSVWLALIARHVGIRYFLWPALAYAFVPVVYIASGSTMDYVWGTAFILGAFYLSLRGRPMLAGLLLGMAIGCRLTSGALILPLAWYWWRQGSGHARWTQTAWFVSSALLTGLAWYLPGLLIHGMELLSFYEAGYPPLEQVAMMATVEVWGTLGIVGFICLLLWTTSVRLLQAGAVEPSDRDGDVWGVSVISIVLLLLAFMRLPHEPGYLVPMVPFILLLVGMILSTVPLAIFCALLCFSSFITVGRSGVNPGQLLQHYAVRSEYVRNVESLLDAVMKSSAPPIIIAGEDLPAIDVLRRGRPENQVRFLYLIREPTELAALSEEAASLYILPRARVSNRLNYGFDPAEHGARALEWTMLERNNHVSVEPLF